MRSTFLSLSAPLVDEEEINRVVRTLRPGWPTTGPRTERFEQDFAQFMGADAALAIHSGKHAILNITRTALGSASSGMLLTHCQPGTRDV